MSVEPEDDSENLVCADQSPPTKPAPSRRRSGRGMRPTIKKPPQNTRVRYIPPEVAKELNNGTGNNSTSSTSSFVPPPVHCSSANKAFMPKLNPILPPVHKSLANKLYMPKLNPIPPPKFRGKANLPVEHSGSGTPQKDWSMLSCIKDKKLPPFTEKETSVFTKEHGLQPWPESTVPRQSSGGNMQASNAMVQKEIGKHQMSIDLNESSVFPKENSWRPWLESSVSRQSSAGSMQTSNAMVQKEIGKHQMSIDLYESSVFPKKNDWRPWLESSVSRQSSAGNVQASNAMMQKGKSKHQMCIDSKEASVFLKEKGLGPWPMSLVSLLSSAGNMQASNAMLQKEKDKHQLCIDTKDTSVFPKENGWQTWPESSVSRQSSDGHVQASITMVQKEKGKRQLCIDLNETSVKENGLQPGSESSVSRQSSAGHVQASNAMVQKEKGKHQLCIDLNETAVFPKGDGLLPWLESSVSSAGNIQTSQSVVRKEKDGPARHRRKRTIPKRFPIEKLYKPDAETTNINLSHTPVQLGQHVPAVSSGVDACTEAQPKNIELKEESPSATMELENHLTNPPAMSPTWKGTFEIKNKILPCIIFAEIQAYPPSKVHNQMYELSKQFPKTLLFDLLPRQNHWLDIFEDDEPCVLDIGLYFISSSGHEQNYYSLLTYLDKNDLLLRTRVNGVELFVFSSKHLPEDSCKINQKPFMWGLLRPASSSLWKALSTAPLYNC